MRPLWSRELLAWYAARKDVWGPFSAKIEVEPLPVTVYWVDQEAFYDATHNVSAYVASGGRLE